MAWYLLLISSKNNNLRSNSMDTKLFTKVKFHHLITLIERDDGNKTYKTLEKEAGLPSV